jgi:ketosteroid isomerase-like protein
MNIEKRTSLLAVTAAIALSFASTTALAKNNIDSVKAAEKAWYAALMNADGAGLEKLLDKDFAYQHPSGNTYSKAEVVTTFSSKRITVTKIGDVSLKFRDYGSTVVAYGVNPIEGMLDGKPYAGNIRFVDVWRMRNGAWKLAHRNSQILAQ